MTRTCIWIMFILSLLPQCLPQMAEKPFSICLITRNANLITLQCRLTATGLPIPDAVYFLNGTRLNFTGLVQGDEPGVSFQLRRDLEGYFTCGNDSSMSDPMALIG